MRFVYLNEKAHDATQAHTHMRELLTKNPAQFMSQMADLEERHRAARQVKGGIGGDDSGAERVLELCGEWLKENGVKP